MVPEIAVMTCLIAGFVRSPVFVFFEVPLFEMIPVMRFVIAPVTHFLLIVLEGRRASAGTFQSSSLLSATSNGITRCLVTQLRRVQARARRVLRRRHRRYAFKRLEPLTWGLPRS